MMNVPGMKSSDGDVVVVGLLFFGGGTRSSMRRRGAAVVSSVVVVNGGVCGCGRGGEFAWEILIIWDNGRLRAEACYVCVDFEEGLFLVGFVFLVSFCLDLAQVFIYWAWLLLIGLLIGPPTTVRVLFYFKKETINSLFSLSSFLYTLSGLLHRDHHQVFFLGF